jgi:hypothetical protein
MSDDKHDHARICSFRFENVHICDDLSDRALSESRLGSAFASDIGERAATRPGASRDRAGDVGGVQAAY